MPSIPAVIKLITSVVAVAQPHVRQFISDKNEMRHLREEIEKLKRENDSLRTQRIIWASAAVILCISLITAVLIILM